MQKGDRQLDRSGLFGRVVSILETSRINVVRSVNSEMVAAYWLIGREIVEELQKGEGHAGYGETALENALISSLQTFLLELGNGFAFVARQKRLTLDGDHFYPDLIFYHMRLKCYVVLDLKTEKLTHGDVGQMQLYVNYYDREARATDDNPTVGLLLCTEKNDAVVRYILGEANQQIFAAKYPFELPTMEELQQELIRERLRIEESVSQYTTGNKGALRGE